MGKTYFKALLWLYALALLVCGAARVMLQLRFIDHTTGFYVEQNGIVLVFNAALLVAVLALFISNRLCKVGSDYPVYYQSRVAAVLAIAVGAGMAAYVILDTPYPVMEQGYSELVIRIRDIVSVVLGVVAGLSMVLVGLAGLAGKVSAVAVVPSLFASLWQVYMLVTRFNSYTTLTTISDNLLAVLFMIFATLFLVGHARTVFGYSRKDGRNYTIPAGLCTSLCGLLLVVPNYVCMVAKSIPLPAPQMGMWEGVYTLLLSIYALVFVAGMLRSIKSV